jgi:hypothetical protein
MATSQQAQPPRGWLPREREHLAAADLHLAALSSAPLPGADLRRANLHEAWLRDSCLHAADLREADLHGAHLEGADLDAAGCDVLAGDGLAGWLRSTGGRSETSLETGRTAARVGRTPSSYPRSAQVRAGFAVQGRPPLSLAVLGGRRRAPLPA